MRKNIDSVCINLRIIEVFEPIILMANSDVLLSVIDLLCHSRGGRTVKGYEITSLLNEKRMLWMESCKELRSHGFVLRIDESTKPKEEE